MSYGTSYSIGDFKESDVNNRRAGFAENGKKVDLYGGWFLNEKFTVIATFRHQFFETNVDEVISQFNEENPDSNFAGSTDNWKTYYFLAGIAYKIKVGKKMAFYPRVALGPMWATTPGLRVTTSDDSASQNFNRDSQTALGVGYDIGIGLRNDFGRHFSLMPTFTFSGGVVNYSDVATTIDSNTEISSYEPRIQSFTLGLSVAYRVY